MSKRNSLRGAFLNNLWLWLELAVFIVVGFLLASRWYRYQINPDGTSYISIAYKYSHFDISHAINGYWGPLFSILLAPFLWLHLNPIVTSKLLNVLAGAGIIYVFYHLLTRVVKLNTKLAHLLVLGLIPSLYVWIMPGPITPDVLMVLALLVETAALIRFLNNPARRLNLALLALAGLGLYLTKYVGFYIFIGQISLVFAVLAYNSGKYRDWLKVWAKVLISFLIIISPVVLALSFKYHKPVVSTAGGYNHGILAPQYNLSPVHPAVIAGPFTPPNTTAYSVWEDPTNLPVPHWSTLGNFHYFLKLVYHNANIARDAIIGFGALVAVGFVVLLGYLLTSLKKGEILPLVFGITAVVNITGYLTLTTEPRYIWASAVFSLLAIALVCRDFITRLPLLYWAGAFFVAANVWFCAQIVYGNKNIQADTYATAVAVAKYIPPHSRINSDTFAAIHICMYDDLQCYGLLTPSGDPAADQKLYQQLKKDGESYYLNFGTATPTVINFLNQYSDRTYSASPTVNIYHYR